MRKLRFLPAIAASLVLAAPAAAAAQPMSAADARAEMQRYCTETANRTDEAGRNWYATYCGPRGMAARPATPYGAVPIAVAMGLTAFLFFLFGQ